MFVVTIQINGALIAKATPIEAVATRIIAGDLALYKGDFYVFYW
jgi:hypothetical protein